MKTGKRIPAGQILGREMGRTEEGAIGRRRRQPGAQGAQRDPGQNDASWPSRAKHVHPLRRLFCARRVLPRPTGGWYWRMDVPINKNRHVGRDAVLLGSQLEHAEGS